MEKFGWLVGGGVDVGLKLIAEGRELVNFSDDALLFWEGRELKF